MSDANLYIYSENLDLQLTFPAYVTSFQDSFKSSFTEEALPFNIDPFRAFTATTRNINVSFDIIGENSSQAANNLYQISLFTNLLYGSIRGGGNSGLNALKTAPPDINVYYFNLIRKFSTDKYNGKPFENGLEVKVLSHDFKPEYDSGFFSDPAENLIYPKLIKMNLNLAVMHDTDMRPRTVQGIRGGVIFSGYPYVSSKSLSEKNIKRTIGSTVTPNPSGNPSSATTTTQAGAQSQTDTQLQTGNGGNNSTSSGPSPAGPLPVSNPSQEASGPDSSEE
jgi:hypothetical protein